MRRGTPSSAGKLAEREHGPALHLGVGVAVDGLDNGADGALAGAPRQPEQGLPAHAAWLRPCAPRRAASRARPARRAAPARSWRASANRRGSAVVARAPSQATLSAGRTPVSQCTTRPPASSRHVSENVRIRSTCPRSIRARTTSVPPGSSRTGGAGDGAAGVATSEWPRGSRAQAWQQSAAGAAPAAHVVVAGDDRHGVADPRHLGDARGDLGDGRRQSARRRALHHLAVRHHRPARRLRVERHPGHRQPRHRRADIA